MKRPMIRQSDVELREACSKGDIATVRRLLEEGADPTALEDGQNSPLILPADEGNLELVKLLVEHGAHVNYASDIGETALGCAVRSRNIDLVKFLLEAGADPLAKDRFGVSVEDLAQIPENDGILEVLRQAIYRSREGLNKSPI